MDCRMSKEILCESLLRVIYSSECEKGRADEQLVSGHAIQLWHPFEQAARLLEEPNPLLEPLSISALFHVKLSTGAPELRQHLAHAGDPSGACAPRLHA